MVLKKAGFPEQEIPEAVRIVLQNLRGQQDKLQNDRGQYTRFIPNRFRCTLEL